jgi:hypothetical protein
MNNFLKDLMKLATKLNQVNGFNATVVINEMELLYDKHIADLKNLDIQDVIGSSIPEPPKDRILREDGRILIPPKNYK